MQERDIVNDVLAMTKSSIQSYGMAITGCSNQQLRSALQKLRDEAEQFQYQLSQIAEQKGYTSSPPTANQQDISQIKNQLNQP
ncbi:spore coat protein [Proteiniborus sp. MB09-C3]|uniref:spore coat protein n=1 Tax=Proteiniborus sp. MB09-C3 TaxID=3050072 RepID=UPI002553CD52|nr:spore coat protein [Proteiniborus sp. MB09-C3]WIV11473.1 spore coat protein [Proteiniborus sp. MB09-C3]